MTCRVTIHAPLGEQLHFCELLGQENICRLFSLDAEMPSESIDRKALLGKNATVEIETKGSGRRYIDGIVTRFGMYGSDTRHIATACRPVFRPCWMNRQTAPRACSAACGPNCKSRKKNSTPPRIASHHYHCDHLGTPMCGATPSMYFVAASRQDFYGHVVQ